MGDAVFVQGLGKRFGKTVALEEASFAVPAGAVYALVGANGAGKTTLIKMLVNILTPTTGRAVVLGMDSRGLAGHKFCRIGYVSENQELAEWTTVGGMLNYVRPFYPTWDRELEQRLIRQFELPLKRKLKQLSRGMRMKAAFVSAMAYRPELIVLDEPLSGLDPFVRDELIEGLREQAKQATVLLSSHDLAEIESFATHVGFVEQGRMLFSEEMAGLMGRFRAVTAETAEPSVGPLPAEWLHPAWADGQLRFAHSAYRGFETEAEIGRVLPDAGAVRIDPMPLRSIFLAIAKSNRLRRQALQDEVAA